MHNGSSKISGSASAPPADPVGTGVTASNDAGGTSPIGVAEDINPDAFVTTSSIASCYHTQMPLVKHASA